MPTPLPNRLSEADVSSIIGMAWQDDTPFEAIALQFGLREAEVIALMREQLKTRSFRVWRMRVRGRVAKHQNKQHTRQLQEHQASLPTASPGWLQTTETDTPAALPCTVSAASLR